MTYTFNTPIGAVRLVEEGGSIIRIELTDANASSSAPTPLLREAEHQITAFLRGELVFVADVRGAGAAVPAGERAAARHFPGEDARRLEGDRHSGILISSSVR